MYFEDKTISVDTKYAASGVVVLVHVLYDWSTHIKGWRCPKTLIIILKLEVLLLTDIGPLLVFY